MKYTNTGIYHYCLNLGRALLHATDPADEQLIYYTPPSALAVFGDQAEYLAQHAGHKFMMPSLKSFHIWHSTFQGSNYVPSRDRRIRVIQTIHDLNFLYDELKSSLKKKNYLRRHQQLVDRADAIICVSEFSRKDVLEYLSTKDKPVYVIYNGTNVLQNPAHAVPAYRPHRPFLFTIGVMHRKKNYHALLPLLQKNENLELVISGRIDDRAYYSDILSTAQRLRVSDQVKLTGQITEQEKAWYFRHCNAFMCASKAEGFGLPVAEAMSEGKPVFLSSRTALSEIGGDAAFYFTDFSPEKMHEQFNAGMKQYLALDMKQAIQARASFFSWRKAAAEYVKVYRSLL